MSRAPYHNSRSPYLGAPLSPHRSYAPQPLSQVPLLSAAPYQYPSHQPVTYPAPQYQQAPLYQPAYQSVHVPSYQPVHQVPVQAQPVQYQSVPVQVQPVQVQPVQYSQVPVQYSQVPVQYSQVQAPVQRTVVAPAPPVQKGELEYIPFERQYYEEVPVERVEYVPIEKRLTDYYAIENQTEYVPYSRYETVREMVPQQRTEYLAQQKTQYVPQVQVDHVTVNRVQERVEYTPVERHVIHYPEREGQWISDAEKSGRIRKDLVGAYPLQGSQFIGQPSYVAPQQVIAQPSYVSPQQVIAQPQVFGPSLVRPPVGGSYVPQLSGKYPDQQNERFLLKKLEKDIKNLEASQKKSKKANTAGIKEKLESAPEGNN